MAELELDMNKRYDEWSILQESDAKLQPLFGPGYTGMINVGNSCYMNSVMQVIFHLQEFKTKYQVQQKFPKPCYDLVFQILFWRREHL